MLTRPTVLSDDHLSQRLLHREHATVELLGVLDSGSATRNNVLLSGSSGVGKTALAKIYLRDLSHERDIGTAHVRSLGATVGGIYRSVIEALPSGPTSVPSNRPVDNVRQQLRETVADPVVVVLDKADDVPLEAVDTLLGTRHVTVVVVCHDPVWWRDRAARHAGLDDRFGVEVALDRFSVDELADIVERRAEVGLRGGVGPDGAVRRCHLKHIADGVAGVARNGIQTLQAAAELAVEREHDGIRDADINDAYDRSERAILAANLSSLPFAHRFLYELVRQADGVSPAALWDRYDEAAEAAWDGRLGTPPTRRTRRHHLKKCANTG